MPSTGLHRSQMRKILWVRRYSQEGPISEHLHFQVRKQTHRYNQFTYKAWTRIQITGCPILYSSTALCSFLIAWKLASSEVFVLTHQVKGEKSMADHRGMSHHEPVCSEDSRKCWNLVAHSGSWFVSVGRIQEDTSLLYLEKRYGRYERPAPWTRSPGHDGMVTSILWAFKSMNYPCIPALLIHEDGNFLLKVSI